MNRSTSRLTNRRPSRAPRALLLVENVALARDHRLRKQARSLAEAGFDVTVICRRDPGNRGSVEGIRVLDYPAPPDGGSPLSFVIEYAWSLVMATILTVRVLLTRGVDVVQVASTPDIYVVLTAPLRLLGRRVVFDFRDLSPEMFAARYGRGGAIHRVLRLLESVSLRAADNVLVVNGSLLEIAHERGGVPAERITVVGNGPPLARMRRRPADPGLRRGHRHLCCLVGMMGPQDSVDLAVRAAGHLVHELGRTDCGFAFVGAGDAVPALRDLTARLGLHDWVTFPGWAEEDLVFDYLCTADLGIEPNLEAFVSPVKAMEYMAVGLPFVAFDVAETRALAGTAAAYAPPGDHAAFAVLIDELLTDPGRRAAMGEAGRQAVRDRVAWEHQRDRYLAVWRALAPGGAARPAPVLGGPGGGELR